MAVLSVSQGNMYRKFDSYLFQMGLQEKKPRASFLNEGGDCNGWSLLFAYYQNTKHPGEFSALLQYIANWDGKLDTLKKGTGMPEILRKNYKNGIELFESTINDVTWFAQTNTGALKGDIYGQRDRVAQWDMVKAKNIELTPVYSLNLSKEKSLSSFLKVASKWKDTWIDISVNGKSGGGHALAVYITAQGKFIYYDCNEKALATETASSDQVARAILMSLGPGTRIEDFTCYKFHDKSQVVDVTNIDLKGISPQEISLFLNASLKNDNLTFFKVLYKEYDKYRGILNQAVLKDVFYLACKNSDLDLASSLLKKGYTVDTLSHTPGKSLNVAVENGDKQVVKFLLEKDENLSEAKMHKALEISVNCNQVEIAKMIIEQGGVFKPEKFGDLLLTAVDYNECNMVEVLLEHNISPNSQIPGGKSALTIAAAKNTDMVILLVDHGANVNEFDNLGLTPLMVAAKNGNSDIVAFLLEHDADPNLRNKSGWNAYDFAKMRGDKEVIDLFQYHKILEGIKNEFAGFQIKQLNSLKALSVNDIFETQKPIQGLDKQPLPGSEKLLLPEALAVELIKHFPIAEHPTLHLEI